MEVEVEVEVKVEVEVEVDGVRLLHAEFHPHHPPIHPPFHLSIQRALRCFFRLLSDRCCRIGAVG